MNNYDNVVYTLLINFKETNLLDWSMLSYSSVMCRLWPMTHWVLASCTCFLGHLMHLSIFVCLPRAIPGGTSGKESACQCRRCNRNPGSIPGLGRAPGVGSGNPLQYSCLENPMDRGAWWATLYGVAKELDMTELASATKSHGLSSNFFSDCAYCFAHII